MEISYKTEDFTPHGLVSEDVIGHILEDVEDFDPRYYLAMRKMEYLRCPLDHADENLYDSIVDSALECFEFEIYDEVPECFFEDIEEVFG